MANKGILYCIDLQGQGDTYIILVSPEIHEWVTSDEQPGRKGSESSWYAEDTPEEVKDANEGHLLRVTSGSFHNDKALSVQAASIPLGPGETFFNAAALARWAREHPEIEIRDEQLPDVPTLPYAPPGTVRDNNRILPDCPAFNIKGHGFIKILS